LRDCIGDEGDAFMKKVGKKTGENSDFTDLKHITIWLGNRKLAIENN
jgi:hypothetical protein